jgi:hypothetical protein
VEVPPCQGNLEELLGMMSRIGPAADRGDSDGCLGLTRGAQQSEEENEIELGGDRGER